MLKETIDTGTHELLCEIADRVAIITLNRPEARNALSDRLTPALRRMIKRCGDDPNVGAILITCPRRFLRWWRRHRVADLRTKQRTLTGALVAVRKPTCLSSPDNISSNGRPSALLNKLWSIRSYFWPEWDSRMPFSLVSMECVGLEKRQIGRL